MDSTTDEKIVSVPYFVYEGEQARSASTAETSKSSSR